nr:hypothetical protein [Pseudomonadota bacterium]
MSQTPQDNGYAALAERLDKLEEEGKLVAAIDYWKEQQSEGSPPPWVDTHLNHVATLLGQRGIQLFNASQSGQALKYFLLALRAKDNDRAALNNTATCLKELGRLDESTALYRRAVELSPDFVAAHSNLLMNLHYTAGVTPPMLAAAHKGWDERHGKILAPATPWPRATEPERRLRLGFVSADLGEHPVGVFLVAYLENIDPSQFDVVVYADGQRRGRLTDRCRAAANYWHDVGGLNDEDLAQKIRGDRIDILIDLSGHSAGNRLAVFARKPAPVQVGWLGYPGDNGLSAMDYVIGDERVLPLSLQAHC